ncbi:MAG: helix-turn-helix domain-containing protein [Muribaculaceae bacterium]|nr:helix-turn-helix domain-containing protein [Muribaculaceae bacterium]MDE6296509.1 helix-turn-helix domain-containing protein [Muribaculaceae bacterium]
MFNNNNIAPAEMIRILGSRFREYRMRRNLTQKDVSERSAISIPTIYKFETGQATDMSLANLLKLMRVVGIDSNWNLLIPELPESPYMYKDDKKRQRVSKHQK